MFFKSTEVFKGVTIVILTSHQHSESTNMSTSDDGGPGPRVEQIVLSDYLNSSLLFVFGMGMLHWFVGCNHTDIRLLGLYTMVYIGTMCLYSRYILRLVLVYCD